MTWGFSCWSAASTRQRRTWTTHGEGQGYTRLMIYMGWGDSCCWHPGAHPGAQHQRGRTAPGQHTAGQPQKQPLRIGLCFTTMKLMLWPDWIFRG
jgi:hypothetical protein